MKVGTSAETLPRIAQVFEELVNDRKSVRVFRPDPVPGHLLRKIFEIAAQAPSNCNTQPWTVHLVGGATRQRLTDALVADASADRWTPEIPYLMDQYPDEFRERQIRHLVIQQTAFGVERDDAEGRRHLMHGNVTLWGAPHVAFVFMPAFGNEREAADIGMFAQTAMLACTALGLGSCPQTSLGMFAEPVKRVLGVDDSLRLLFGLAIGYEDRQSPSSRLTQTRRPLDDFLHEHH